MTLLNGFLVDYFTLVDFNVKKHRNFGIMRSKIVLFILLLLFLKQLLQHQRIELPNTMAIKFLNFKNT